MKCVLVLAFGGECENCGYNKDPAALDFHHVDPKTKIWEISKMLRTQKGFKLAYYEAKKCKLLCANCHREEGSSSYKGLEKIVDWQKTLNEHVNPCEEMPDEMIREAMRQRQKTISTVKEHQKRRKDELAESLSDSAENIL